MVVTDQSLSMSTSTELDNPPLPTSDNTPQPTVDDIKTEPGKSLFV